jgi:hypothetical protein
MEFSAYLFINTPLFQALFAFYRGILYHIFPNSPETSGAAACVTNFCFESSLLVALRAPSSPIQSSLERSAPERCFEAKLMELRT